MKRLFNFTLTVLFLISVCFTFSVPTESKEKGGAGKKNTQIYGYIYISDNPYSIWYADGTHAYTMIDHGYDVYNFSERSCSYDFEFKQWFAEYDIERGVAGNLINEAKELGYGSLDAIDNENLNWPDYQDDYSSFSYHYLPEWNLQHRKWYVVGGYTRLSVLGRRGSDSWQVYSNDMTFQWWDPGN